MTDTACPECGASVPEGFTCGDNFHALLALEWDVPGGAGELAHFYAVASYALQHPGAMRFTRAAISGLCDSVTRALDGSASIEDLRSSARAGAKAAGRVTRRDGDTVPTWPVERWSVDVTQILSAGVDRYAERVESWARSVLTDIAGRPPG